MASCEYMDRRNYPDYQAKGRQEAVIILVLLSPVPLAVLAREEGLAGAVLPRNHCVGLRHKGREKEMGR